MNAAMLMERAKHIGAGPYECVEVRNGHANGFKPRRVTTVMGELCGFEVSSTQVTKLTAELDLEFEQWRNRPLAEISHLFTDATCYKVRIAGNVRSCATLIAIGIRRENGKRLVLGVSCALSEAEVQWRDFLTSLKERGLGIPDSITSDAHVGLRAALRVTLNSSPWQRCQFHLQQNARASVPTKDLKSKVADEIPRSSAYFPTGPRCSAW